MSGFRNTLVRLLFFALLNGSALTAFMLCFPACYTENRPELSDDKEPKNNPVSKKTAEPSRQKTAERRTAP